MNILGLVGYPPLGRSRSPELFRHFFERDGAKGWDYKLFPMEDVSGLRAWLMDHPEVIGLNVTIPHKEAVIPLLDVLDESARDTGAVNCIKVSRTGGLFLKGYNTDIVGFAAMLDNHLQGNDIQALILGTGGGSKAVQYVLRSRGIPFVTVSRSSKADLLYLDVDEDLLKQYHLIINTTPLGMPGIHEASVPFLSSQIKCIGPEHICLDLVYNHGITPFTELCSAQGAAAESGMLMLEAQAEAAWKIFQE